MKHIAPALQHAFSREMGAQSVPADQGQDYLKWLRYYLDFCVKFSHPPGDSESLEPFLQKLAARQQSLERQKQAPESSGTAADHLLAGWLTWRFPVLLKYMPCSALRSLRL